MLQTGAVNDPDLFWHVRLGDRIRATRHLVQPETWSYVPRPRWVPTAWLSEVLLSAVHSVGGFAALRVTALVVGGLVLAGLAVVLRRSGSTEAAAVVFAAVALPLAPFVGERPQLFSLPFLVWLAWVGSRALRDGRLPPWWQVMALTWLWANLHGLWVLAPVALLLLGSVRLAVLALLAGCLTPAGPALVLAPFRVASAARALVEWQPTRLADPAALGLVLVLLLLAVGWARRRTPLPWPMVVWVVAWSAYGMLAFRNVGPATILLAPVAVWSLTPLLNRPLPLPPWVVGIACAAGLSAVAVAAARLPATPRDAPLALVRTLDAQPGPRRVLDDYNVGGFLVYYGHVQVAIDGRAERYGRTYVARYLDLMRVRGDWRATLAALHPDYAFLDNQVALADVLANEEYWQVLGRDHGYVLLKAP